MVYNKAVTGAYTDTDLPTGLGQVKARVKLIDDVTPYNVISLQIASNGNFTHVATTATSAPNMDVYYGVCDTTAKAGDVIEVVVQGIVYVNVRNGTGGAGSLPAGTRASIREVGTAKALQLEMTAVAGDKLLAVATQAVTNGQVLAQWVMFDGLSHTKI